MNSRGGLPILRGGLPLGTISKDLPIHISADSKRSTWRSTSLPYGIFLEGAGLSFAIAEAPQNGVLVVDGADVTYTPNPNYNGEDAFTYVVSDGASDSAPATVTTG